MTPTLSGVYARAIGVATVLAAAGAAWAQETAQLFIQLEPAVIVPGQSATVRVFAQYSPVVGSPAIWNTLGGTGQLGTVAGFALAVFHVLGNPTLGVSGSWSNITAGPGSPPPFPGGGTISGNNVLNNSWGTGFGPPLVPAFTTNPVLLVTATWTAAATSGPGMLGLTTDVLQGSPAHPNSVHLWLQGGMISSPFAVEDAWPCADGQAVITVIPAPGAAMAVLAGAWSIARRPRPT
ncbi:MAG: hypothetical protein ACKVU4_14635 [Phycisphaerales bacterium]